MLADPGDAALRQAFSSWIVNLMKARKLRAEDWDIKQLLAGGEPMIAETMDRWTQEWLRQGRKEGLQQSRDEGLQLQKALVRQQAERKFGSEVAATLGRLLAAVADPGRVREVALALVDCETPAEVPDQVR